jgi:hypothetical protein
MTLASRGATKRKNAVVAQKVSLLATKPMGIRCRAIPIREKRGITLETEQVFVYTYPKR